MFLQNHWYAVAWDHEIKGKLFPRKICGEDIVFYRQLDGSLVALEDCCPHRMLPLSKGTLKDGEIVCGYHGFAFNCSGACTNMPSQDKVNKNLKVKSYPIEEKHRLVWVWIGDPEKADTALIHDMHWCSDPDWVFEGSTYHVKCDYRLLVDNLMDLTHEAYVHPTSIGQVELMAAPIETKTVGDTVVLSRWMKDITPPPFWSANLKSNEQCDRWQICNFSLPAMVNIDVGVAPTGTGAPEGDRSQGVTGIVIDIMTPETETTTWYHWGMVRNFDIHNRGLTGRIRDAQAQVFHEDIDVLESQQLNINARPDQDLKNFNIDSGGFQSRKIIEQKLAEQATENL
jgi:vanillate monooxygenase